MVKISVIMPSLNVAKYIKKCMDSVVNQTMKDIEIIVVDAGSVDGTEEIIRSYAERDARVRFIHSDKKSYGYQVNVGLSMAAGEYVGIVETDDWIEPDTYEVLYQYARKYEADYVRGMSQLYKETDGGLSYGLCFSVFPQKLYEDNHGVIWVNPQEQKDILRNDAFLWNGIYNRNFLRGIKLNETAGASYQDVGFLVQVYDKAVRAVYVDKLIYHYRKDNDDCSCYSRNAFRYLAEEYRFVQQFFEREDKGWKLFSDAKYFQQIYTRFRLMAQTGSYWEEAVPYIEEMQEYFQGRQDVLPALGESYREGFVSFLETPRKLYEALEKENTAKQETWNAFLDTLRERKIIIFGSGKRGYFLQFLLYKKRVGHVLGYCDNDLSKTGQVLYGLKVKTLEEWRQASDIGDICYVITARAYAEEIEKQLLLSGIAEENIVLFDLPMDFSAL